MRNRPFLLAVPLLLVGLGVFHALVDLPPAREASAQSGAPTLGVDDWSGTNEHIATANALAVGTIALIDTGVSGKILSIKALTFASSSAAYIYFYDKSDGSAAHCLGGFYAAANTPYQIPRYMLGKGLRSTTVGNGIYCQASTSTTLQLVARVEPIAAQ